MASSACVCGGVAITTASTLGEPEDIFGLFVDGRVREARETRTCIGVGIGDRDDFGAGDASQRGQMVFTGDCPATQEPDPDRDGSIGRQVAELVDLVLGHAPLGALDRATQVADELTGGADERSRDECRVRAARNRACPAGSGNAPAHASQADDGNERRCGGVRETASPRPVLRPAVGRQQAADDIARRSSRGGARRSRA